jgi:uncharacterized protein (DUF1800 family)
MSHFLRRAGFGPAPGEVERRIADGWESTVRTFVEPGSEDEKLAELDRQIGGILDFGSIDDVRAWWIYRMIHSRQPLVEKMTFFWHGHFATSVGKVGNAFQMAQQNRLFRERALGPFGDLLARVARDPAMLVWLDGSSNKKARPNENFAREVMELFTVGAGEYTEVDVREAARAFTGWTVRDEAFFFDPGQHDAGPKRFLGHEGPLDGSDVLRILAEHPATARRLSRKLFEFFVHEAPDEKELAPAVAAWKETRGDVREVLRTLFLSPSFVSQKAWRARVKSPADYVIGSIRSLGGTITPRQVSSLMARMGQDLFNPPSVKGWDGGKAWISTSSLFERFNFAASITTARGPVGTSHVDPQLLFGGRTPTTAREVADLLVDHFLDGDLPQASRDALIAYLETPAPLPAKETPKEPTPASPPFRLDTRMLDEKVRGAVHLILSTPEYQLS